jgi:hypothetical protein
MISLIRTIAKLATVIAAAAAIQPATQACAGDFVAFVSNVGSGVSCTAAQPCGTLTTAMELAENGAGTDTARVICLNPVTSDENSAPGSPGPNTTLEVDCPLGFMPHLDFFNANTVAKFRGVTFTRSSISGAIYYGANGTLIFEDCVVVDSGGIALDIEPNGPLNLVIRNSRISNGSNGAAILLKPAAGGSIKATFDHVVITGNNGGGIKTDATNGLVNLDVSTSEISNNVDNGIIAIAPGVSQNVVSVRNSVIARNGQVGIEANGANAAVLVQTTLLDQNVGGATLVNGGHISTYGTNSIVGSVGSGFTATAGLQ